MDTTSNTNLKIGDNTMKPIFFFWQAIFSDGSKIEQFENGIEHKFKEVQDKFSELVYFNLINRQGKMFAVDLINGRIGCDYLSLPYIESKEKKQNIRLIFFRRHRVEIGTQDLKEKKHTLTYYLGYQWDFNNQNRNIILQIQENGDFIINGK